MQQYPFCNKILTHEQLQELVAANEDELMTFCEKYLAYDKQGKVRLHIYGGTSARKPSNLLLG